MECPFCGGVVEEHELSTEAADRLREQHGHLEDAPLTKMGCTNCGNVLYSRS